MDPLPIPASLDAAGPLPLATPRRRRRWMWRSIAALVGMVLVALFGGVIYVAHYEPLQAASGTYGVHGLGAGNGELTSPGGATFRVYRVDYVEGKTFSLLFPIDNLGRLPVTITNIGFRDPFHALTYEVVEVRVAPDGHTLQPAEELFVPFRPFRLEGNELRQVLVTVRMANRCPPTTGSAFGGNALAPIDVAFQTVFVHKTAMLELPFRIDIRTGDC